MNISDLDDSNPMAKLLATAPHEPTIFDDYFQKKEEENKAKNSGDSDKNIGLSYRQPSYSSLHGTVVTKSGDASSVSSNVVNDPDPVVVFDGHADDDSENEPIELGIRQPSFVSLQGQIIPKGAESLADLHTVIEEVDEEPMEDIPEDDDESDQQVKIVKCLQAKNANRWAEIGYEPPQDLIPIVRAKSQAQMAGQELSRNGYVTTSLSKFYTLEDIDKANGKIADTIDDIPEEQEQTEALQAAPTPTRRKRSGSFGMKLGEASASMERLQYIIPEASDDYNNDIKDEIIEENDEDNQDAIEEEEEEEVEEEMDEEEEGPLFGHLNEVVEEDEGSPVFQTILTGENPPNKAVPIVRVALKKYLKISEDNSWNDEASFINNLLEKLPVTKKVARKDKASPRRVKREKAPKKCEKKESAADAKLERKLAKLDEDYKKDSEELDEYWQSEEVRLKYSSPSIELLELRSKLGKAKRARKGEEAARIEKKIRSLEAKETAEKEKAMQSDYFAADKKLKEKYAIKRETVIKTHEFKHRRSAERVSHSPLVLRLNTPSRINRENDLAILKAMTREVLNGKKVSDINIEKIFNKIVQE